MLTNFLFPIIRRWLWLLLLVTLVTAGIGYFAAQDQPVTYRSEIHLLIGPSLTSSSPDLNDLRAAGQLLETYAVLVTTRPFLESVIAELDIDLTASRLGSSIEVSTSAATQILDVQVTDSSPDRAMVIANTIAEHLVALSPLSPGSVQTELQNQIANQIERIEARIAESEGAIGQLESILAASTGSERVSILNQISQERSRMSSSEQILLGLYETLQEPNTNQLTVIEPAVTGRPNNPQMQLRVITGALAGVILTLPVIFLFEYFRGDIRRVEDIIDVPVLGTIYTYPGLSEHGADTLIVHALPGTAAAEEYRRLATEILLADTGQAPHSIMITSIGENSEIGEIAANLALVLAQVGSSVALIDANLHQPTLVELFKLPAAPGLTDMLDDVKTAHKPLTLEGVDGLNILPSGKATSTPFAALAAPALIHIIETLKDQYKLLVIIAPPFNDYAEGLLLAARTDNTILVTHAGSTHKELQEAVASLKAKHIRIIGTIYHRGPYTNMRSLKMQQQPRLAAGDKGQVLAKANNS